VLGFWIKKNCYAFLTAADDAITILAVLVSDEIFHVRRNPCCEL